MINCTNVPLKDKGCHFIAGFVIAVIGTFFFGIVAGLVLGAAVGILKEAYDEYSYGGADFFDLFATIAGTVIGAVIVDMLVKYYG